MFYSILFFEISSVEIKACDHEYYGHQCQGKCGHCLGNNTCNRLDGVCSNGCESGYQGDFCKTGKYINSWKNKHRKNDSAHFNRKHSFCLESWKCLFKLWTHLFSYLVQHIFCNYFCLTLSLRPRILWNWV